MMPYNDYNNYNYYNKMMIYYTALVDPCVIETLKTVIGQSVVIETVRGNLQGILADVQPDHIVVQTGNNGATFFVRIQQIVSIMPD